MTALLEIWSSKDKKLVDLLVLEEVGEGEEEQEEREVILVSL